MPEPHALVSGAAGFIGSHLVERRRLPELDLARAGRDLW